MILDNLRSLIVEYTKAKDMEKLGVLRYYLSAVKNKEIELRPQGVELNDEHAFKVLKKQLKQLNESLEMYEKGGRTESIQKTKREIEILNEFAAMFPFPLE
ncbi:hypothetical protein A2415_01335 [candidate division WWE3 bacterium RIFOXYC1_FULL_39_7]|uniref:Uncharacterized protein n=2 Tax=Katanobacteria TaxID=422282 RepID=A0A1F4X7B1_UNCKA|nr:MAG: hypothetical protein A2415_01335 [candidate division WWE3 bacterium RIFOXYC1_FULL_39_7]OGC77600.1 MAG: hypothetical protein A2619_04555 [candidate division WWE3 bacterium RIFOXYD1_FULL_39_9]